MKGIALTLLLLTGACAAIAPRVDYRSLADKPRADNAVTYALTDTIIVIGAHGTAKPGAAGLTDAKGVVPVDLATASATCTSLSCEPALAAVAVPTDFTGEYLTINPRSRHLVSTTIAPTYVPDSLRLKSLTVEAKDHRVEVINAIGAVASGVVGLASGFKAVGEEGGKAPAPPAAVLKLPLVLDLAEAKAATNAPKELPGNKDWKYKAQWIDDPKTLGFLPRRARAEVHGALLTSICRPLRIILQHPSTTVTLVVTVADPDWLLTVPLPAKGAVTPHPLCGADVQAQPVTEIGYDDLATAFSKQVAAVRAARTP